MRQVLPLVEANLAAGGRTVRRRVLYAAGPANKGWHAVSHSTRRLRRLGLNA